MSMLTLTPTAARGNLSELLRRAHIRCHHRWIAATANSAVSLPMPTVTPASLVAMS